VDYVPSAKSGPSLAAVTGFKLNDLSALALAPSGRPPFRTIYSNFAPRVGVAYQLAQLPGRETVVRGGFGVFYDLATQEIGSNISTSYPYTVTKFIFGPPVGGASMFPLSSEDAAPPAVVPASLAPPFGFLAATDPNLKLPYTLEWNVAIEQALGQQQGVSMTYAGATGRRLIQAVEVADANASIGTALIESNIATQHTMRSKFNFTGGYRTAFRY